MNCDKIEDNNQSELSKCYRLTAQKEEVYTGRTRRGI